MLSQEAPKVEQQRKWAQALGLAGSLRSEGSSSLGPQASLRRPWSPSFQALFRGAEVVHCGNFSLGCWARLGCLPWIVSPNGAPGGLGDPHRVLRSADQAALWKVSIRSPGPKPWRRGGGHLRPHSKFLTDPQGWNLHLSSPSPEVFLL